MIVIKYGGSTLSSQENTILQEISQLHQAGEKIVVVHGGAALVNEELAYHKVETKMIDGFRYTDKTTMEIVQRVLSGQVLRNLVNELIGFGCNAVGLTSGDGEMIRVRKMQRNHKGEKTDFGLVGEVESTNPNLLLSLLNAGYLPVVSPVGTSAAGEAMNLNGDLAAGAVGAMLNANEVIFLTDVAGIYRDYPNPDSLISNITLSQIQDLLPSLATGMIPKVKSLISALEGGAKKVRIADGRVPGIIKQALTNQVGTVVIK